ncbi:hypothetical protein BGW38_005904 [Lunasporangiospora selenospora]|uniref:Uncharacterized protein n=1 Tax=Lunasporangiospora selenospora TaxID=979761 RepID=A0A9P6FME8_9FUNG|nr:hypothetical protein BGW38_005904 [Lunasporangiospora selenospora]
MQRRVMTNYLYYYNYQHHKDLANIPEAPIAPGYDDMTWTRQDLQILMARYHPAGLREFGLGLEPSLLQLVPDLMCAHRLTRLELCAIKEETKLEPIIDFIATHNRQYGTLRDLKIQGSGPSHDPLRLVQCMDRPRLIDLSEWAQPVMRLDRIARDHLESLHLRLRERSPSEVTPIFLSTCPSLKILTMQVNKPDLFKPFIRDRFGTNSHPFWSELQSEDGQMSSRAFNTSKESLGHIPLSHMELSGEKSILVPCLMDIASAFQDTLQELVVNSWHFADHSDTKASLAWNHILPRLTRLELKGPIVLAFNLDTLVHCPSLRSLILDLPTLTHSVSGHKLASLASLRQLRELSLEGKWYIGDHLLDYLSDHLQSLERLSLEGCMGPTSNGLLKAIKKMKSLQWYCNTSVGACMRLGMTLALL